MDRLRAENSVDAMIYACTKWFVARKVRRWLQQHHSDTLRRLDNGSCSSTGCVSLHGMFSADMSEHLQGADRQHDAACAPLEMTRSVAGNERRFMHMHNATAARR